MSDEPSRTPPVAARTLAVVLVATAVNLLTDRLAGTGPGARPPLFLFDLQQRFDDYFKFILSFPPHGPVPSFGWGQEMIEDALRRNPYAGSPTDPRVLNNVHVLPLTAVFCLLSSALMRIVAPALLFAATLMGLASYWMTLVSRHVGGERQSAWLLLGLVSYPVLMTATRGNVFAGMGGLLVVHAVLLALKGRAPVAAALLLAVAVNIRPPLGLFLLPVLALRPRPVRTTVVFGAASLAIFCASLAVAHSLYPTYSLANFRAALAGYHHTHIVRDGGVPYGSSLFGALKVFLGYSAGLEAAAAGTALLIVAAGAALHLRRRLDPPVLVFLTLAAYTLGSTVIADYHLFPFVLVPLAVAAGRGPATPTAGLAAIAAALMLAPKNFGELGPVSVQVVLNPALLLATAGVVIAAEWRARWRWPSAPVLAPAV